MGPCGASPRRDRDAVPSKWVSRNPTQRRNDGKEKRAKGNEREKEKEKE